MNVGEIRSFLADKLKRSDTSAKNKALLKESPPIPSHKTRKQRGYSVVVIGKSGKSRQYELSESRTTLVCGAVAVAALLSVVGLFNLGSYLFTGSSRNAHDPALVEKLTLLQEELRNKEVALSIQEKRLSEERVSTQAFKGNRDFEQASGASDSRSQNSLQASLESSIPTTSANDRLERSFDSSITESESRTDSKALKGPQKPDSGQKTARSMPDKSGTASPTAETSPIVNFNTQDVSILPESPGSGTLSFRLVKDHPDMLFSGFLFVFVEMEDKRGENKIYVYPDKTRLGEGDLPSDFKEGESISFKYNSRVELPFGDIRSGAQLARVSILLYGDNGKIVFQRGFDKKELSLATSSGSKPESNRPKTASEKRKPL